jgi:hypothetical protein
MNEILDSSVGLYKEAVPCHWPNCGKLTRFYIVEIIDSFTVTLNLETKESREVEGSQHESAIEHPICAEHLKEMLAEIHLTKALYP